MERLTIYDELAECYKIKPEANSNVIQRLGKMEADMSKIEELIERYNQGDIKDSSDAWKELLKLPLKSLEEEDE